MVQELLESGQVDRNDPNYDSGEEKHAVAFHSRKVEQVKAYKQAVSRSLPSPSGVPEISLWLCSLVPFAVLNAPLLQCPYPNQCRAVPGKRGLPPWVQGESFGELGGVKRWVQGCLGGWRCG